MKCLLLALALVGQIAQAESIYRAKITIGDRTFHDIIVLHNLSTPYDVTGSLTVPGVFTAPLKGVKIHNDLYIGGEATENGNSFYVNFRLKFSDQLQNLKGSMSIDGNSSFHPVDAQLIFSDQP
jgi:hypothetical protein